MRPTPRKPAPPLSVATVSGARWDLDQPIERFALIVFYRGLHCPICKGWLAQLDQVVDQLNERGVDVVAISCDSRERAERTVREWGLKRLTLGYGLTIEQARTWDLYISHASKEGEPPVFSEPGLALVAGNGMLYAISIQSMPFARPNFDDVVKAIDFVVEKRYPARGEA